MTASLAGLTIAQAAARHGGGIDNAGTLNVTNSAIDNNFSSGGGGIYNAGTLTVTDSTIAIIILPLQSPLLAAASRTWGGR